MKRFISLLLTLILCISLSSCTSNFKKHPIDAMKEKIEKSKNCQITINMAISGEIVSVTSFIDGNIEYCPQSVISEEFYIETIGDTHIKYTKTAYGTWVKTQYIPEPNDLFTEESMNELFNSDNYDVVKDRNNMYKQKSNVAFYNFSNVIMTIDAYACTINAIMLVNGVSMNVTIIYSNIGMVNLTLPVVA